MAELWKDLQPPKKEEPISRWLLTFTDLVSLLMGFFVLLFSTKELDTQRWQDVSGSFQDTFSAKHSAEWQPPKGVNNAEKKAIKGADDQLTYLDSLLQQRLGEHEVWKDILKPVMVGSELRYQLPQAWVDGDVGAASVGVTGMGPLAREIQNWNNTATVRLVGVPTAGALANLAALYGAVVGQGGGAVMTGAEWQAAGGAMPEGLWLVIEKGDVR
ncbi:MAG: flagellar motor protein MotB [Alphaproteobacteria bacterium]